MCVKHAPRLNQGPLSCGPLFPMFFGRHLSIPCCSISSEDAVQIDRTFSLLLETASGFELEPIPRSARYVARRATTERSAISRIVAKVLRPDCGGGGTGWTGGALMPRHGSGRSGRAPSNSAPTSSTREGTVFAGSVVDASLGCCVSRNPSRGIMQWTLSASGPLRCVTDRSAPPL